MTPKARKALEAAKEIVDAVPQWHNAGHAARLITEALAEPADVLDRLTAALATANSKAEHFEREWYLRGDEIERLTDGDVALPDHPEPMVMKWSELEIRAITDYGNRVRAATVIQERKPKPCCGKYAQCIEPCTVRGREVERIANWSATYKPPHNQPWICLLCKSDRPGRHTVLDDKKTPCPNGVKNDH